MPYHEGQPETPQFKQVFPSRNIFKYFERAKTVAVGIFICLSRTVLMFEGGAQNVGRMSCGLLTYVVIFFRTSFVWRKPRQYGRLRRGSAERGCRTEARRRPGEQRRQRSGTGRIRAEEEAAQVQDDLHQLPAGGAREGLLQDALPGRVHQVGRREDLGGFPFRPGVDLSAINRGPRLRAALLACPSRQMRISCFGALSPDSLIENSGQKFRYVRNLSVRRSATTASISRRGRLHPRFRPTEDNR